MGIGLHTAGWGHAGKAGVTMPGRGRLTAREPDAVDVWLNADVCWQNVPNAAWEYVIGGYQVLKKWLSYREYDLLSRAMTEDEVREFRDNARRLTALAALHSALDDNYRRVAAACSRKAASGRNETPGVVPPASLLHSRLDDSKAILVGRL